MATAPPSDQPATMILVGSTSLRPFRWASAASAVALAARLGRLASTHAVANVLGGEHVDASRRKWSTWSMASLRHIALP